MNHQYIDIKPFELASDNTIYWHLSNVFVSTSRFISVDDFNA